MDTLEPDPELITDLTVLQRIGRGLSTTQDQLYIAMKLDELRKLKNEHLSTAE
jgi:hypothetical protein